MKTTKQEKRKRNIKGYWVLMRKGETCNDPTLIWSDKKKVFGLSNNEHRRERKKRVLDKNVAANRKSNTSLPKVNKSIPHTTFMKS
jgi:hypothetical protein